MDREKVTQEKRTIRSRFYTSVLLVLLALADYEPGYCIGCRSSDGSGCTQEIQGLCEETFL